MLASGAESVIENQIRSHTILYLYNTKGGTLSGVSLFVSVPEADLTTITQRLHAPKSFLTLLLLSAVLAALSKVHALRVVSFDALGFFVMNSEHLYMLLVFKRTYNMLLWVYCRDHLLFFAKIHSD